MKLLLCAMLAAGAGCAQTFAGSALLVVILWRQLEYIVHSSEV